MPRKSQNSADKWDDFALLIARCQNHYGTLASELQLIAEMAYNLRLNILTNSQNRKSKLYRKVWTSPKTSPQRRAKGSKASTRKAAKGANSKGKLRAQSKLQWNPQFKLKKGDTLTLLPSMKKITIRKPRRDRHAL